jgi:hypothetical protein
MGEKFEAISLGLLMLLLFGVLLAWPTQLLWNGCLVQAVDGINPIGFWQALGINVLCQILFNNSKSSKD